MGFSEVRLVQSLVVCVVFRRPLFIVLSFFLFAVVLSVLRLTAFDYSFGILNCSYIMKSKIRLNIKIQPLSTKRTTIFLCTSHLKSLNTT